MEAALAELLPGSFQPIPLAYSDPRNKFDDVAALLGSNFKKDFFREIARVHGGTSDSVDASEGR